MKKSFKKSILLFWLALLGFIMPMQVMADDYYLTGSFNGWNTSALKMSQNGGQYEVKGYKMSSGTEFKVVKNADWNQGSWGYSNVNDKTLVENSGGNAKIKTEGCYSFYFKPSEATIYIVKETTCAESYSFWGFDFLYEEGSTKKWASTKGSANRWDGNFITTSGNNEEFDLGVIKRGTKFLGFRAYTNDNGSDVQGMNVFWSDVDVNAPAIEGGNYGKWSNDGTNGGSSGGTDEVWDVTDRSSKFMGYENGEYSFNLNFELKVNGNDKTLVRTIKIKYTIDEFELTADVKGPIHVGDKIDLTVSGGTSPYTWEKSKDGLTWTTISGVTSSTYTHTVADGVYIRVKSEGKTSNVIELVPSILCDPENTDTIFVETFGTLPTVKARKSYNVVETKYSAYVPSAYQAQTTECAAMKDAGYYAVVADPSYAGCSVDQETNHGDVDCNCTGKRRWYRQTEDHTPDDTNGGMLFYNCKDGTSTDDIIYECVINDICAKTYINFSAWVTNANTGAYGNIPIEAEFRLFNATTGRKITSYEVTNIKLVNEWREISAMFNSDDATKVKIQLVNKAGEGQGNDLLLDDITLRICTPKADLACSNGKNTIDLVPGQSETLTASLISGIMDNPYYLWQYNNNKTGWQSIGAPTQNKATLTVTPESNITNYRVIIANTSSEALNIAAQGNPSACGMYAITNEATLNVLDLELKASLTDGTICDDGTDNNTLTLTVKNPVNVAVSNVVVNLEGISGLTVSTISNTNGSYASGVWTLGQLAASGTATLKLKLTSSVNLTAKDIKKIKAYINKVSTVTYGDFDASPVKSKGEVSLTVNPLPKAIFNLTSENICSGSSTTLAKINLSNGTPNYTLTINGNNYSTANTSYTFSVSPTNTTTYTISKVADANGCSSTPSTGNSLIVNVESISISSQPTAQVVCVGDPASFSVQTSGADKYTWQVSTNNSTWQDIPRANLSTYNIAQTTAADNGKYYRVKVEKVDGKCEAKPSNSALLTVKTTPAPSVETYSECAKDGDIELSTLATGTSLKFYSDAALTSSVVSFDASDVVKDKKYYVTQTLNGCTSDAATIYVTVKELPKIVSVTTDDLTICSGETPTAQITITGGVGQYEVEMEKIEGSSSVIIPIKNKGTSGVSGTSFSYNVTPTMDTKYVFKSVKDANECSSTSDIELDFDVQKITLTSNLSDITKCADQKAIYNISATGENLQYQWYESIDNGVSYSPVGQGISYETNPFIKADDKNYSYYVVVSQNPQVCEPVKSKVSHVNVNDCSSFELTYTGASDICKDNTMTLTLTLTNKSGIQASDVKVNITNLSNQTLVSSSSEDYNHDTGVWSVGTVGNTPATLQIVIRGKDVVKNVSSVAYVSKSGTNSYTESTTVAISSQNITVKGITDTPIATDYYSCPVGGTYSILDNITSDKSNLIIYKSSTGDEKISEYVDLTNSGTSNKEYLFYVSNTEDEKCESLRKEIKATVYVKPTANISGNTTICKGQSTDLEVALFGTKDYTITYTEKVGNTTTDKLLENVDTDNKTISVSPNTTTTYALKEVIDGNSCKATLTGNVEVVVNDKAEISISAPEPICAGDPLDLTNKVTIVTNGSTVTNGNWYLDDAIYTEGSPVLYEKNGAILKYKATSSCGGTIESTNSFEITVKAQANITITAPADLCIQNPLQLQTPTINYNGSTVSGGKWYLDGEEYNGADLVYKDEAYTLQYKANSSCGGETRSNEVTFKVKNKPTINLTEVDLGELCAGTELDLPTVTTKENNSTISSQGWLLGTSSITSPINSLSTDVHDGKTITYTATNECGTTKVDYTTLSVKDCADFTLTFDLDNSNPCFEDEIILTATITNNGGSDLSNVVLSLQGPNAQASVTSSTSGDIVSNYSAGVWTIPTFTSKATATLTIKFSAQASEELKIHVSESNGVPYASYTDSPAKDTEELVVKEISAPVVVRNPYDGVCPTEESKTVKLSDLVTSDKTSLTFFDKDKNKLTEEPTFDSSKKLAAVTYYITNQESEKCESKNPTEVNLEIFNPISASISTTTTSICSGTSSDVNITVVGGTPDFTIVYNNGGDNITETISETSKNITESLTSDRTYKLISVTDSKTCSAYLDGTELVTVKVNPRPELVSFEIEDSDDIICEGTSTNLKANFKGTPDFTFTLQTTKAVDGVTKTETTDYTINDSEWSMEISEAGQYKITKLSDEYCESETLTDAELTLIVEELPELTLSATDVTLNCTTSTATITASGAYKYEWSYLDQTGATQTKSGSTLALQQTDPEVSSLVTEYTVYGYSENANCQSVEAKTVKVTEDFVKPVASIKVSERTDGTIQEWLDCNQETIKLEADITLNTVTIDKYIWSDGSDADNTIINKADTYTLQVVGKNGCISEVATKTIAENIIKPQVSIDSYVKDPITGEIATQTKLTCTNKEITLDGKVNNADEYSENYPNGEFTYLWSDGATTSSTVARTPLASSPMEYTLIVTAPNGCDNSTDKAKVTITEDVTQPVLDIKEVYELCPSDTLTKTTLSSLLPKTSGVTYKFYDESGDEIEDLYDASSAITEYYVTGASANGCESEKVSFAVDLAKNVDFTLTASQTSMLVGGNETVITIIPNAESDEADTYTWQANGNEIAVDGLEYSTNLYLDTKFEVTATNRCDSKSQEVSIEVLWPTAFTPHNDNGKNDDFAKGMPIIVFNRFYTKIFEGPDGWDGTINGTMNDSKNIAVPGVYYYKVDLPNGEVKKGTIEIVR